MTWLIVSYPKQNPKTASDLLWRNEILLPINTTRLNQCTKEGRTPTGLDEEGGLSGYPPPDGGKESEKLA